MVAGVSIAALAYKKIQNQIFCVIAAWCTVYLTMFNFHTVIVKLKPHTSTLAIQL